MTRYRLEFMKDSMTCFMRCKASATVSIAVSTVAGFFVPNIAIGQDTIEEILVLGTNVTRKDYESPSPTFTIDSETLMLNGTPTLTEHLNRSPQLTPAADRTSNNPGTGRGELNLRGLGPNRTLVMIDGKRLSPAGTDGAVDINIIPTTLVERVEVLTGGASAVYGSDAISGVVNVQLRRDFEGFEFTSSYDITDENDGEVWDITLAGGRDFADGRGNISGFISSTRRDDIATSARDFSSFPISDDFFAGNLIESGSPVTADGSIPRPAFIDGAFSRGGVIFMPNGDLRAALPTDTFNFYGDFNYLQTGLKRGSAGLFTQYSINENFTAYADVFWSQRSTDLEIAPTFAGSPATRINLDNPNLTSQAQQVLAQNYDPNGTGFITGPFRYRMSQLGGRESNHDRDDIRVVLGLKGSIAENWSWSASYSYSDHQADRADGNFVLASRVQQSLLVDPLTGMCFDNSNGCVPGNFFGAGNLSNEAAAFIAAPDLVNETATKQQIAQFVSRGSIKVFDDRELSIAGGLEWRKENSSFTPDPIYTTGDVAGFAAAATRGSFDVAEVYGEFVLPLLTNIPFAEELALEAGARYSDYSTVGDVSTWKAGLSWRVNTSLLLRVMNQSAVRAPNIQELFQAREVSISSGGFFGLDLDSCSASLDPNGNGLREVCISQGLAPGQVGVFEADPFYPTQIDQGGNTALEAEQADTFTAGFTWQTELAGGFSMALDYYAIEIDNAITEIDRSATQTACFSNIKQASSELCQAISRDLSGNIALVRAAPRNAAELTAKGIDLQMDLLLPLPWWQDGSTNIRLGFVGNKNLEQKFKASPAASDIDCAGNFGLPCNFTTDGSVPEHRTVTTAAWQSGAVSAQLIWRWIDGMNNGYLISGDPGVGTFPLAVEEVGSENYFDLNVSWLASDRVELRAGIINIADTAPPLLGFNAQQSNTNPNLYDVLGRRFHASMRVRF